MAFISVGDDLLSHTLSRAAWCPRFASVFWTLTWAEEGSQLAESVHGRTDLLLGGKHVARDSLQRFRPAHFVVQQRHHRPHIVEVAPDFLHVAVLHGDPVAD